MGKKSVDFDTSLDRVLVAQIQMLDPEKREKAEILKLTTREKLNMLQNIVQTQTVDGSTDSALKWAKTMVEIVKINQKLPKKARKSNRKLIAQIESTAAACNKGWEIVALGRAKQAAKN